ncbi:hypothetical protein TPA0598_02_03260 [Streptomyces lydicamycinicus]|uniref:Uncharacterized protein n=1 Tax=Streptomyces lydicamycinicus TaxID=1546107 RepID=A0A0P4R3L4_9ACTN|nr:hypothetical protein [Streptomyces lydicamycinicus]GAO07088.1 hypothetical protein TPA0598_02_03260 [Streptomyces lydicamycinicus]
MALVTVDVEPDVPGIAYEALPAEMREALVTANRAPTSGAASSAPSVPARPATPRPAFGNANADAQGHCEDHYTRPNFVRIIEDSPWPE